MGSSYIVAKEKINKRTVYTIYTTDIGVEQVQDIELLSRIKNNAIDLENAVSVSGRYIKGKHYSLDILPSCSSINAFNTNYLISGSQYIKSIQVLNTDYQWCNCMILTVSGVMVTHRFEYLLITGSLKAFVINNINGKLQCESVEVQRQNGKVISNTADKPLNISKSRIERLKAEAGNPNIVWSMKDFKDYMWAMGYGYEITGYSIGNISNNCKIVHIPKGIKNSLYLYRDKVNSVDTLIFPAEFNELISMYKDSEKDISLDSKDKIAVNNIYFQSNGHINDSEEFKGSGFCNLRVTGKSNLPAFDKIIRMYNMCILNSCKLSGVDTGRNANIKESFLQCIDSNINIKASSISSCFVADLGCNILVKCSRIKLSFGSLENCKVGIAADVQNVSAPIEGTLQSCKNCSIVIKGAGKTSLKNTFKHTHDCDIKLLGKYSVFEACFAWVENISGIIDGSTIALPPVKKIVDCFYGSCIKRVVTTGELDLLVGENRYVQKTVKPDNEEDIVYEIHTHTDSVSAGLWGDKYDKYEFVADVPITRIRKYETNETAHGAYKFDELDLPKTLEILDDIDLRYITDFDSRKLPCLREIGKKPFDNCTRIKDFIVDVEKLGGIPYGLILDYKRQGLENIFLGEHVKELSKNVEEELITGLMPYVYLVEGSAMHKYLSKYGDSIHIELVKDADEAIKIINERREQRESDFIKRSTKIKRVIRALGVESKHSGMIQPSYTYHNSSFDVYELMERLKAALEKSEQDSEFAGDESKLDTSKFKATETKISLKSGKQGVKETHYHSKLVTLINVLTSFTEYDINALKNIEENTAYNPQIQYGNIKIYNIEGTIIVSINDTIQYVTKINQNIARALLTFDDYMDDRNYAVGISDKLFVGDRIRILSADLKKEYSTIHEYLNSSELTKTGITDMVLNGNVLDDNAAYKIAKIFALTTKVIGKKEVLEGITTYTLLDKHTFDIIDTQENTLGDSVMASLSIIRVMKFKEWAEREQGRA